jgi:hypothetical protein
MPYLNLGITASYYVTWCKAGMSEQTLKSVGTAFGISSFLVRIIFDRRVASGSSPSEARAS